MFSIADIQAEEESEYENPEEGGGAEDEAIQTYPIRVSLSVTKVRVVWYRYTMRDDRWTITSSRTGPAP